MRNEIPAVAAKPTGPPLEGEALEQVVAAVLCRKFRETPGRVLLREGCRGVEHSAIEAAIVSPTVQGIVEPVMKAFTLEQTVAVICLLLISARAALESEKPTPAQVAALKIVFETVVERPMTRIGGNLWDETPGNFHFSDYEKSLVDNLLALVRAQRAPAPDGPVEIGQKGD
ncbi:MAG TPA: hypothetical protein VGQ11_03580 [Candidatus Acidoferrales bacterium]|nr:hypothetical protein [Candidatus Acidoferrales bacterium]